MRWNSAGGRCHDNSCCESMWARFKEELLYGCYDTSKMRVEEVKTLIRTMIRLTEVPRKPMNYDCIDIMYANDITESDKLLRLYKNKGYTFITFTPSQFVSNGIDHYSANINSHQVIGQEFDNVVIIMDNNFRYSDDGDLEGKEHPNPDYLFPRLFYQNISRTRERLCIIVLNNPKLFRKLLMIKENEMVR